MAAGKVAPSPMPSTKRAANSETRPVTAPVAIVVIDHTNPQTVRVRPVPEPIRDPTSDQLTMT